MDKNTQKAITTLLHQVAREKQKLVKNIHKIIAKEFKNFCKGTSIDSIHLIKGAIRIYDVSGNRLEIYKNPHVVNCVDTTTGRILETKTYNRHTKLSMLADAIDKVHRDNGINMEEYTLIVYSSGSYQSNV